MALIKCDECNNKVSNKAVSCPHCGIILDSKKHQETKQSSESKKEGAAVKTIAFILTVILFFALKACDNDTSPPKIPTLEEKCNDEFMAIAVANNLVLKALSSPSTAKFPTYIEGRKDFTVTKTEKCVLRVNSYVDAQNAFGTYLRKKFNATVKYDERIDHWKVIDFDLEDLK